MPHLLRDGMRTGFFKSWGEQDRKIEWALFSAAVVPGILQCQSAFHYCDKMPEILNLSKGKACNLRPYAQMKYIRHACVNIILAH